MQLVAALLALVFGMGRARAARRAWRVVSFVTWPVFTSRGDGSVSLRAHDPDDLTRCVKLDVGDVVCLAEDCPALQHFVGPVGRRATIVRFDPPNPRHPSKRRRQPTVRMHSVDEPPGECVDGWYMGSAWASTLTAEDFHGATLVRRAKR